MGDDGRAREEKLSATVLEARRRLARIAGRESLRRRAWWVLGAGAAAAMCRPLVWRVSMEAAPWVSLARAAGLFAAGACAATAALIAVGRRRGPSDLGAARAIDGALGSSEVIASGFAFARDERGEPVVMIARRRAVALAETVRPSALFPLPSLRPTARAAAVFVVGALAAMGAGGYERSLATALLTPPTSSERAAAAALEEAAAELIEAPVKEPKDAAPEKAATRREKGNEKLGGAGPALAGKAKDAARAAKRGDRRGALEKLEGLRNAGRERSARAGDLGATLRKLADALSPSGSEKSGAGASGKDAASAGKDAAESMRLLADKMRSPEGGGSGSDRSQSDDRVLERLERAAEEARRAGSNGGSREANDAARALSRAAASLKRGERAAAAEALAQAAERAAAIEAERAAAAAEAMAIAEMLDRSGALERAIQAALLGQEGQGEGERLALGGDGKQGEGEGEQGQGDGKQGGAGGKQGGAGALRGAIMARLAAMGMAEANDEASNGSGPHAPDRHRRKSAPLTALGSIRAPSEVGEGPRAIQAINGLGKGTEPPKEYREVFPSYDAAAEEGLADERIPAPRRAAVRRYFQAIRPDQQQ